MDDRPTCCEARVVALTSPASAVPAQEFKDRQARVVEQARERGLDAVLVWSRGGTSVDFYGDVLYLTGHHSPFPANQDTTEWSGRSYSAAILPVTASRRS